MTPDRYRLAARDPSESHRVATPLELFFDLISVIAIASVTAGLHHAISEGHGIEMLPRFVFLFTAIWWAWMNFTWFASAFDSDGPVYRLLVMLIMTGELIFAGGAGYIFQTLDMGWGILGWCIMRLGMAALWLRASANPEYRITCQRYAGGIVVAQLGWVLMYLLIPPGSPLFFAAAIFVFLIEFAVPVHAERHRMTPFHRHHIIERYGLLTIISLGEIMLAISLGFGLLFGAGPSLAAAGTALAGVIIVFALFWLYFSAEEHLTDSHLMPAVVWGYGHVFVFGAIAALGAGIAAELDLVNHHSQSDPASLSRWIGVPLAVFFVALWLTRDRQHDLGFRGYALPAMALVSLAAAGMGLPSWGFALVAIAAVIWRVDFAARRAAPH